MVTRPRIRAFFSALILYAIAAALIGYFGANAYSGNYGLNAREVLEQQAAALTADLDQAKAVGARDGLAPAGRAELPVDADRLRLDRIAGEEEARADLPEGKVRREHRHEPELGSG